MIIEAIRRYYPDWDPPEDLKVWNRCLCPFHGEEIPSAAVSYAKDAFNCLACSVSGDAIAIIRNEEEVNYSEAKRIAAGLSGGSDPGVPKGHGRQSSRRVFGEPGSGGPGDRPVQAGVRGRTTPWA